MCVILNSRCYKMAVLFRMFQNQLWNKSFVCNLAGGIYFAVINESGSSEGFHISAAAVAANLILINGCVSFLEKMANI